jgi:hypothetical protein
MVDIRAKTVDIFSETVDISTKMVDIPLPHPSPLKYRSSAMEQFRETRKTDGCLAPLLPPL